MAGWRVLYQNKIACSGRISALSCVLAGLLATASLSVQAELYFNVKALHLSEEQKAQLDLSLLSQVSGQLPGEYRVHINVNQRSVSEKKLQFVTCGDRLCPELSPGLLKTLGVKIAAIPRLAALPENETITDIAAFVPQATADFNFEQRQLNLTIPQAALDNQVRGYIPPERWEEGMPMFFSSYSLTGVATKSRRDEHRSQYLNLRNGANLGAWRLRNYSYYNSSNAGRSQWRSLQTWLERDIRALRSRLVMGEATTPGLVFDSFSFRGIAISSQDEMLPFSMRGYAPTIRGVAMTNATVEIRQNGNLLYQTFVPPGDFVINDLYATGTSGDLEIVVREENGVVRRSVQAFATPPVSLRQGRVKYAVAAGEYGSRYDSEEGVLRQPFLQAEAIYGALNNTSFYGGVTAARHYQSTMLGVGQGLGTLGAISLDITHAETHFDHGGASAGQSWQLRYGKRLESTGTTLSLAAYRFDTEGYFSFDEASRYYHSPAIAERFNLKNRAQLTLNQDLDKLGSVALSAWQQNYWHHRDGRLRAITSSWSKTLNGISINLSQSLNKSWRTGKTDNLLSASFSLPVGKWLAPQSASAVTMSNRLSWSHSGGSSMTTTLFGTALEENNLSWSAAQSRMQYGGRVSDSTALAASFQGAKATLGAGYSNYYGQNERVTWSARGSIVAHPYGVTLSQPLTEGGGYALVRTDGASDVRIINRSGLATDSRGYAVVPSLAAYQENEIALDTSALGDDIDLAETIQKKVPTREALVLMNFATRKGFRVFLTITYKGKPLPLGAVVSAGEVSGIADERGQVYLTGVPETTRLQVALPGNFVCRVPFDIRNGEKHNGIVMAELTCKN